MLDIHDLRVLGGLIDTTFGRTSIREAGHAIAYKLMNHCDDGHTLEVRFETIVNINSREGVQSEQTKYDDISLKMINETIKQLKADFRTSAGKALKIKEFKSDRVGQAPLKESFLEIISFNPSLLRGRYYRTIQYHIK
tara:strand:- start:200 stop:613 length:414 start_codon:yes stop_codon:yes gene_type:complete